MDGYLCRGLSIHSNEWVIGYYVKDADRHLIMCYAKKEEMVDPDTVGRYAGIEVLGEKVFIGDYVSNNFETDREVLREVVEHNGCVMLKKISGISQETPYIPISACKNLSYVIVGNIYGK